jgi:hypothetical protein
MPWIPSWRFEVLEDVECYALDWMDIFRLDVYRTGQPTAAEMRGFHVVFRLRVQHSGRLTFFDSDGCIIRRNGEVVHEDRERHPLQTHETPVRIGDYLEVAQWQAGGRWIWCARWEPAPLTLAELLQGVESYRRRVEEALTRPEGPALKVFSKGVDPIRCVLSIYSLVLNGYRPAGVHLFGDYQWSRRSRRIFESLLPFADIVSLDRVERRLDEINLGLAPLAREVWGAMKVCIGLFCPPQRYCVIDDDVFVLDRIDDALRLFDVHAMVYAPDGDDVDGYRALGYPQRPGVPEPRLLRNMGTGFYLLDNRGDLRAQSERLLATPVDGHPSRFWEHGFFAWEFGNESAAVLPSQRYFVPCIDGLPGGFHGYDWRRNPCEFACVHFRGEAPKPGDEEAAAVFHDVLRPRHNPSRQL